MNHTHQVPQMPTMPSFTPSMDLFSVSHNQNSSTLPMNLDVTPTRAVLQSGQDDAVPAYVRAIFMRLDKIEESLAAIQSILSKDMICNEREIEEFTRPLQSSRQLEEASDKLKDTAYRKKVVDYLALLGGKTPGDSVRRMMRKIGTNALWATYSLKGRRGKKKFQDLIMHSVIIQACHKIHPTTLQTTVEGCIADTLRYAPHRSTQVDDGEPQEGSGPEASSAGS
ncbi:uncharacterized protein [Misgurnus anguillicaudatus]|uniref:uncharacterized protein n=1 Tax=Misgurnus anguillicaudatus TaxID=75329 RepID=UPI002434C180|nr:uncharacterized protein LOC129445838 [Misgurnus anguillicaudatus]